jgi:hypothetical protein
MAKKKAATKPRKRGNPKLGGRAAGSKNRDYKNTELPRCSRRGCGSYQRSKYHKYGIVTLFKNNHNHLAWIRDGFTHRVWRSCRCPDCGQWRKEWYAVRLPQLTAGVYDYDEANFRVIVPPESQP